MQYYNNPFYISMSEIFMAYGWIKVSLSQGVVESRCGWTISITYKR